MSEGINPHGSRLLVSDTPGLTSDQVARLGHAAHMLRMARDRRSDDFTVDKLARWLRPLCDSTEQLDALVAAVMKAKPEEVAATWQHLRYQWQHPGTRHWHVDIQVVARTPYDAALAAWAGTGQPPIMRVWDADTGPDAAVTVDLAG